MQADATAHQLDRQALPKTVEEDYLMGYQRKPTTLIPSSSANGWVSSGFDYWTRGG